MDYETLESIDKTKHKDQLVKELTELRKKHEEVKMVLKSEKEYNLHYQDVVEIKDRALLQMSEINNEFLKEVGKLRAIIKRLTNE
jgi:hypothetical protein|tara:strand:- start:849 stop:1103 length:255 start_codon:yes stop_codon:yes gene_type:complete